jgi:uncharacterized OsmC-like protein
MFEGYRVEVRSVDGGPTALGWGKGASVVVDRPLSAGGRGFGFNGGQLLYMSIAACWCNDLYREAATLGIELSRVAVRVDGDFPARGSASSPIEVHVEVEGVAPEERLAELVRIVEDVAEIPCSIRQGTPVTVVEQRVVSRP